MNSDNPPLRFEPNIPIVSRATGELVHIHQPRTASEAFAFLSMRTAEHSVELRENPVANDLTSDQWLRVSAVLKVLADFSVPLDSVVSARHVRWAYATVLRRVPDSGTETRPLAQWLSRVPSCAPDKAAPAALLFHYLAHCCGMHAEAMPQPQGKLNEWFLQKAGGLVVPLKNEEAYSLSQQRHFWGSVYRPRLLHLQGVLLKEICGLEDETMMQAVAKAAKNSAPPAVVVQTEAAPPGVVPPAEVPAVSLARTRRDRSL